MKRSKTNYVLLTKNELFVEPSIKKLCASTDSEINIEDMKRYGSNYILSLNDDDITYVQDKRRMANIPWQHLIKKDMTLQYLIYIIIALNAIMLIRG